MFRFLTGDMSPEDYGGKWYQQTGPDTYLVIEVINWEDCCGSDAPEHATHNADLSEVTIADPDANREACRSYGLDLGADGFPENDYGESMGPLALVEALHGHGSRAPLGSWDGDYQAVLRRAGKEAARLMQDPDELENALELPVNKIGSTAREYRSGDIASAVLRGLADGDPRADLMARMGALSWVGRK